jgi:M6 family metalloprotease-like protein
MKKILLSFVLGLLCIHAGAIPADPTPIQVTQPDGSKLTLRLQGDEFVHYTTTLDGYTVLKNADGYYTYARLDGGRLVASDCIAHDLTQRTSADYLALASIPKGLIGEERLQSGRRMMNRRNGAMRRVGSDGTMDYDNFKGLIILINYTDKKFSMSEPSDFYNDMVNTPNYTGYTLNGRRVYMTGSVRDYFYDNSNQIFDPSFDVVGPFDVSYSCRYPNGTSNAENVFLAALRAADDTVDYSNYDTDGDGYVDMVFFLVAGFSANYTGNDDSYLWPHMFYLYDAPILDDMEFGLYACSTEIAGWENYYSDVNGIGTFCHEFGHVLGLPDLYDTDYSGSGGESRHPGDWSIMSGGSGDNFGRNPVGYCLYERYALGFTTPTLISSPGPKVLDPLDTSNQGLRLNTPNKQEYFLLENRQAGKWDRNLPGHGMLVARVDSSNVRAWEYNDVNVNPHRMYYYLLRAQYSGRDSGSDPFPGTANVTELTNYTSPSLLTWNQQFNEYAIKNITESNGKITFMVEEDNSMRTMIEDFEDMPLAVTQSDTGVQGLYAKWDFVKCGVEKPAQGSCNGSQAVGMVKPSQITTSAPLSVSPFKVQFTVFNPTSNDAGFKLSYSVDEGQSWQTASEGTVTVKAGTKSNIICQLPTDAPVMLRINQMSGNAKAKCYLDDIKLYYTNVGPRGDVDGDREVTIGDVNAIINLILSSDATDEQLTRADVNEDGEVNIGDVNMLLELILNAQ